MTSSPSRETDDDGRLDESYVQDAFHSYLKSSLAQAKAERLLDVEVLSSAQGDLMITGPALCLYFAALRCTTEPPSVPLPRREKSAPRVDLSLTNCPTPFIPFLRLWSECVPTIQHLSPEHQHDLARIICDLPPLSQPVLPILTRLSADFRSIAIEISQRRSFQDRYASDLQAAIDVGAPPAGPGSQRVKASFEPPPMYTPSPTPTTTTTTLPKYTGKAHPSLKKAPLQQHQSQSRPRAHLTTSSSSPSPSPSPPSSSLAHPHRTPTIATPMSPAIELIRETLYAALADVLSSTPSLLVLLKSDPPRAYFGAVALAILAVSSTTTTTTTTATGTNNNNNNNSSVVVIGVRGVPLTLAECPVPLRPLMREFAAIGREAALIEEEDTEEVIRLLGEGRDAEVQVPRLERARLLLERGAGYDVVDGGRRSAEGRAVAFANRVSALALGMTQLPQFRERQDEVFKVLAGVGFSSS